MARLASVPERRASFEEDRTVAALATPVHVTGRLAFRRPAFLSKISDPPTPETIVADGSTLALTIGDEPPRAIDLDDHPEVGALVETIRGTLAGDLPALTRTFSVRLEGDPAGAWSLLLAPTGAQVARLVTDVRIAGTGTDVREVTVRQPNGDGSHMTITPAP